MRVQHALATLLWAQAFIAGVVAAPNGTALSDESIVEGAYIVEFDDNEGSDVLYRDLKADGIEVEHRMDLKFQLLKVHRSTSGVILRASKRTR